MDYPTYHAKRITRAFPAVHMGYHTTEDAVVFQFHSHEDIGRVLARLADDSYTFRVHSAFECPAQVHVTDCADPEINEAAATEAWPFEAVA